MLTTRSTPPKASAAASTAACTASASVTSACDARSPASVAADLAATACGRLGVEVGDHDAGALGGEPLGDRLADAGPGAGDERDPAGERLGLGHPLELGLLERPVLDAELLASSIGAYVETASAPRITLIALT